MLTFTTVLGASGTLVASGIAGSILSHYGKEDLAKTLNIMTYIGAYGYGLYLCFKVIKLAAGTFLGIF